MVDIYEIAPRNLGASQQQLEQTYAFAGQEARMARYRNLLAKLSTSEEDALQSAAKVEWAGLDSTDADTNIELQHTELVPIKVEGSGELLVGNFADAAAAMR
jgi:hypothetical protein